MGLTVVELAEKLHVERQEAYGLIKFLEAKQLVSLKEVRKEPGSKGKGANVYEFPEEISLKIPA